jgi:hypothetical protein
MLHNFKIDFLLRNLSFIYAYWFSEDYIKKFVLIDLLEVTLIITSAKSFAQLNTLTLGLLIFEGIESVTINSSNLEFSIFS